MNEFAYLGDGHEHLDLILATSEIGIWELDAGSGTALRNLRHDQIFGHDQQLDAWSAEIFLSYVFEEDRDRVRGLLEQSLTGGVPWSFETRIRRADGIDRWISAKGRPKFDEAGNVTKLIGHVIDITETKQNEDRLKLLTKELNHRVGNTFAIMNSMIRHAARKSTNVNELAETLMVRLGALSRANRVLVAEEAERSSLVEILDMELAAFSNWQSRIAISGDARVWFSGEASEALAMIFHELLTNAVKHGALSVPGGQITVTVTRSSEPQVLIRWKESRGPGIAPDRPTGIGSSILRNAMRDEGTVELDFSADGLACDIIVYHSYRREIPDALVPPSKALPLDLQINAEGAFNGRRLLVVEDDPIIGMDLAEIFRSRGAIVLGPITTVASALKALRDAPDAALLDVNLGQETTEAIAMQMRKLSIPFLIITGQMDSTDLADAYRAAPIVRKPFDEPSLMAQVAKLLV